MGLLPLICIGVYGLGAAMKVAPSVRWAVIGVVYCAAIGAVIALPEGNELRVVLGGSPAPYLLLLGVAVVVFLYRSALNWLRQRANQNHPSEAEPTATGQSFTDAELERYARHIVMREIGGTGQKTLKNARVLVIGAGGLGAPALQYLAAAGVGTIGVIDDDLVENANLQRQVIHSDAAIGMPKVFSAQNAMLAQNPFVTVRPYHRRLTEEIAATLFAEYDIILDGSDNFETRYLVSAVAAAQAKPLVSGALSQWEGQLSVFDPAKGGPCYACIFPEPPAPGLAPSCAEAGVFAALPGVIGAMMAGEAMKLITGAGTVLRNQMLIYDALYGETRTIALQARADCRVCKTAKQAP